jgi:hypothetical protein
MNTYHAPLVAAALVATLMLSACAHKADYELLLPRAAEKTVAPLAVQPEAPALLPIDPALLPIDSATRAKIDAALAQAKGAHTHFMEEARKLQALHQKAAGRGGGDSRPDSLNYALEEKLSALLVIRGQVILAESQLDELAHTLSLQEKWDLSGITQAQRILMGYLAAENVMFER